MNTNDLILSWTSKPYKKSIGLADGVTLSQFALDEYTAEQSLANYTTGIPYTILFCKQLSRTVLNPQSGTSSL